MLLREPAAAREGRNVRALPYDGLLIIELA